MNKYVLNVSLNDDDDNNNNNNNNNYNNNNNNKCKELNYYAKKPTHIYKHKMYHRVQEPHSRIPIIYNKE